MTNTFQVQWNLFNLTCIGEKFGVRIDRVSDNSVENGKKATKIDVG